LESCLRGLKKEKGEDGWSARVKEKPGKKSLGREDGGLGCYSRGGRKVLRVESRQKRGITGGSVLSKKTKSWKLHEGGSGGVKKMEKYSERGRFWVEVAEMKQRPAKVGRQRRPSEDSSKRL